MIELIFSLRAYVCVVSSKVNSLLQLDHLRHNMFNRGRSIKPMGIPKVNSLDSKPLEALFNGNGHVCCVAAETKPVRHLHSAEFCSDKDILAFLGIQGEPFTDDILGIAL